MLYKVGVLHDRGSLPFSITNNKNAHSYAAAKASMNVHSGFKLNI